MTNIAECIRLANDLVAIVTEETERLLAGESAAALRTLIDSKARLVEQFEAALGVFKKSDPAALKAAGDEAHEQLEQALQKLIEATAENGQVVLRKQALTDDLLNCFLDEARRSSGASIMRYGENGGSKPGHRSAAVAVDARL